MSDNAHYPIDERNTVKLEIDIDLNEYLKVYDTDAEYPVPVTIEQVVIDAACKQLVARLAKGDEWDNARKRATAIRDEEIREQVKPLVEQALAGPIRKTNTYGEPTGGTTTLREMVAAEAAAQLKTGSQGSGYNSKDTTLTAFVKAEVERTLKSELKKELDAAKEAVKVAVREQGAQVIEETITRLARV